jgi:DNA polymerase-3 subunit gamma/tau
MANEPLITKYRPHDWHEVFGHEGVVESLKRSLSSPTRPHAFLFHGPSGIGKTTIARIIGKHLNADIVELDAATHTGVDAMRELVELCQHRPLSGTGTRLIILDEAHMLSRSSFNAVLKTLEEPPEFLFIALCTTEPKRIPETILTRVSEIKLEPLDDDQISDLIEEVAAAENWSIANDVFNLVVKQATGQPRKALKFLQAIAGEKDRNEINRILALIDAEEPVIKLCRLMIDGAVTWDKVKPVIAAIDDHEFEAAQMIVGSYFAKVMVNGENERKSKRAWQFLEAITFPTSTFDRKLAFLAAIGRILWGDAANG